MEKVEAVVMTGPGRPLEAARRLSAEDTLNIGATAISTAATPRSSASREPGARTLNLTPGA
jgi:hypothetical protein